MKKSVLIAAIGTVAALLATILIVNACTKTSKGGEEATLPDLIKNGFVWKVTKYALNVPIDIGNGKSIVYEWRSDGVAMDYLIFTDKWMEADGSCQVVGYERTNRFIKSTFFSEQEPFKYRWSGQYNISFKNTKKTMPLLEGDWVCVHVNDRTFKLIYHSGNEHAQDWEYVELQYDSQL